jgi:coenzyme Q-binding protein COQ10
VASTWSSSALPVSVTSFGFSKDGAFSARLRKRTNKFRPTQRQSARVNPLDRSGLLARSVTKPGTMSIHTEKRFLPYPPAQLFEVVAAVDRYPEFLPWCLAARIRSSEKLRGAPGQTLIVADLVIGFGMIRERYRSRVILQPPQRIVVTYVEGPFRFLNSSWTLEPVAPSARRPKGGTMLTFHVEFEFRSTLLQSLMVLVRRGSETHGGRLRGSCEAAFRRPPLARPVVVRSGGRMNHDASLERIIGSGRLEKRLHRKTAQIVCISCWQS